MKTKFYYLVMCLCLLLGTVSLASCGDDDDEPTVTTKPNNNNSENGGDSSDNGGNNTDKTAEIMAAINGYTFYQRDYEMDGSDGWDYKHYITFEQNSAKSGTVTHKLDWRDIEDGRTSDRGSHTDKGTFVIENNRVKISLEGCPAGPSGSDFELIGTTLYDGDSYMTRL